MSRVALTHSFVGRASSLVIKCDPSVVAVKYKELRPLDTMSVSPAANSLATSGPVEL